MECGGTDAKGRMRRDGCEGMDVEGWNVNGWNAKGWNAKGWMWKDGMWRDGCEGTGCEVSAECIFSRCRPTPRFYKQLKINALQNIPVG